MCSCSLSNSEPIKAWFSKCPSIYADVCNVYKILRCQLQSWWNLWKFLVSTEDKPKWSKDVHALLFVTENNFVSKHSLPPPIRSCACCRFITISNKIKFENITCASTNMFTIGVNPKTKSNLNSFKVCCQVHTHNHTHSNHIIHVIYVYVYVHSKALFTQIALKFIWG